MGGREDGSRRVLNRCLNFPIVCTQPAYLLEDLRLLVLDRVTMLKIYLFTSIRCVMPQMNLIFYCNLCVNL
jgi:hypothetical protein